MIRPMLVGQLKGGMMAYADYMHCEVCDAKVYYDADIDYSYHECFPVVLCDECNKTHEIIVCKREQAVKP